MVAQVTKSLLHLEPASSTAAASSQSFKLPEAAAVASAADLETAGESKVLVWLLANLTAPHGSAVCRLAVAAKPALVKRLVGMLDQVIAATSNKASAAGTTQNIRIILRMHLTLLMPQLLFMPS